MTASRSADLVERIRAGDLRAMARAATLVEMQADAGREIVSGLFPFTGRAITVGITGPPGAGKSTLVDQLAKTMRNEGKTVGIIAVDPSSPFTRGAILGDRIRMQDHHADPGVFIRSTASRGNPGGMARSTFEMALLLDAAGREVVLIETVGVGQDEVEVAGVADVTLVVLVPGMGDDVQAIKAGIMEIADLFVINKADLPGADRLEQDIRGMQSLGSEEQRTSAAPLRRVIARDGTGIEELWGTIVKLFESKGRRTSQVDSWTGRLRQMVREDLLAALPESELLRHATLVAEKMEDPYTATNTLSSLVRLPQS